MNLFGRGRGTKDILFHILAGIEEIKKEQQKLMAAFKDLQDGIAKLGSDITAEIAAVIAKLTPVDGQVTVAQADIDAAVANLTTLSAQVEAETAALSTPPAPAA